MHSIDTKFEELGLVLPTPSAAVANYVPYVITGNLVVISGQLPVRDGEIIFKGKVGVELSTEQAQDAARLCGLNILTQLKAALNGDWARLVRCVRLGGFVNCTSDYTAQPSVINGASNLMVDILGVNVGRHARAAVGVNALPLGAAVEIEATFEIC
ncbi:MAG: RidA family protein [Pseudomonadota bacterium]